MIEKERQLADGIRGEGWGRSQIIRRRQSLVLYKSVNSLCSRLIEKERQLADGIGERGWGGAKLYDGEKAHGPL
jgi:hypothetical protein